jgi:hypothetical protein
MNIYWFGRQLDKDLAYMSDLLEDSGFYGWLLPYQAGLPDPFVRVARSLNTDQKLKYLVAVRPYTMSPQYLLAITKGLDLIQKDRVRINFVPGLTTHREEYFAGILGPINDSSSLNDRKKYLCSYIEEFRNMNGKKPYTYISGLADYLCPNLLDFGDANIVSYGLFLAGKLEECSKDTIISFPVSSIKTLHERMNHLRSAGYNNLMINLDDPNDFELALKIFKEIKSIQAIDKQE